jgi:hypothetical protein
VSLKNTSEATQEWWSIIETSDPLKDLIGQKHGIFISRKPMNLVEKIASCPENTFLDKNYKDFFALTKLFSGKYVCC